MKKLSVLFAILFFVSFALTVSAQEKGSKLIQSGSWSASKGQSGYTLDSNSGDRSVTVEINFEKPFDTKPKVFLSVSQMDADKNFNHRYSVEVLSVSRDGFTIKIRTWADSKITGISGYWLAYNE